MKSCTHLSGSVAQPGDEGAAITDEAASRPRCILGKRLPACDFDRQLAEFHTRVAVLNVFTALGMPVTKAVG